MGCHIRNITVQANRVIKVKYLSTRDYVIIFINTIIFWVGVG